MICVLVLDINVYRPQWTTTPSHLWAMHIKDWFTAVDTHDARREAHQRGYNRLAQFFYGHEWLASGQLFVSDFTLQRDFVILSP
jgi:hypothetical protein